MPTTHQNALSESLYEKDFSAWCFQQANVLKKIKNNDLDNVHLIEELSSMGSREVSELENRFIVLFVHLLKWQFQADKRSKSWKASINVQRKSIKKLINRSPSLQGHMATCATDAYEEARIEAANETNLDLDIFPDAMPWNTEIAMTADFFP